MIKDKLFVILLFLCTVGLCAGAFFEVYMEGTGKEQLMELLSTHISSSADDNFLGNYYVSAKSCFKIWAFTLLCPLFPFLALSLPMVCLSKGLSLGFSATMLVEAFGFKGTWYILMSIMPKGIIQIPVFCFLSTISLEMSLLTAKIYFNKKSRKKNINALQQSARHYIIYFALSLLVLLISCLIEVFLKQSLL